jgi:RIO-like serine/threonine protein kinase
MSSPCGAHSVTLCPMALDVEALAERGERIGRGRNLTKADVYLVRENDRALVVKTVASRPAIARIFFAGALLRREGRVLARLRGTPGVPELIEATGTSLVLEWRPGRTLFDLRWAGISEKSASRITEVLAGIHARGFAHGDIGRRDVLVDRGAGVTFLDFATAVGPGTPPFLWRVLLPIWRRRDTASVGKLVSRYRQARENRDAATQARGPAAT